MVQNCRLFGVKMKGIDSLVGRLLVVVFIFLFPPFFKKKNVIID